MELRPLADTNQAATAATGSVVPAERDPWRSVVRRGPVVPGADPSELIEVPEQATEHRAPPITTLVGAGIAALGAGVLAAVLGQMLFAMFAAVGAIASFATWAVGALVARRDRRRTHLAHGRAVADFEQALRAAHVIAGGDHRACHRSIVDALDQIYGDGRGVWARRCGPDDALSVTVGRGTCLWTPRIAADDRRSLSAGMLVAVQQCERLDDVAVPLALERSSVIAIHGAPMVAAALCRSIIVQLAGDYGPADWELQVVTSDPECWSWVTWLPQARHRPCLVDAADSAALADALECVDDDGRQRRTVIVVDAPTLLSSRTGPLRRRLDRGDVCCIALVAPNVSVPALVDRILEVGDTGAARWIETTGASWNGLDHDIVVAGISRSTAQAAARRLAPLLDPEDDDGTGGVPASVSLSDLETIGEDTAMAVARRWKRDGVDPAPVARLGVSADGVVDIDLVRDGPHGLVAGTTGSGKSELLRTLVVSLAAQSSPDHLTLILVDYKGGATFDACARLPHTVGVVTDLDDGLAERVLVSLDAEVRRRERLFRAARVDDLAAFRRSVEHPLPRLVVVIDEFASLAKEIPDFLGALVSIAQRGRSLGIHLLLATQRPAGVVTDDIRANTNLRIALRLQDRSDAEDVVGDPAPARFAVGAAGRAALRLGPGELVVFQTAESSSPIPERRPRLWIEHLPRAGPAQALHRPSSGDVPSALERLVESIGQAAALVGTAIPHRPWIDALPRQVRRRDLGEFEGAVGLLDDPAAQCRRPLTWQPTDGTLLLVGAHGSGTTTAATAVVAASLRRSAPEELHLYVIDARGDVAWTAFEASTHCGAVVRVSQTERVNRLLGRIVEVLDRRSVDGTRDPVIVVAIDGFAALRDAVGDLAHGETARRLDRVLRDGPAAGVVAVVTTDGASSAGLAVPRAATWVFHVSDSGVARTAGLRGPSVRAGVPGRLRVVESGLEGQVVLDLEPPGEGRHGTEVQFDRCAAPVEVLPDVVEAVALDARLRLPGTPRPRDGRPVELLIGLGADDLEPAFLRVPVGDHVFVGGAARTGRSTALRQIEAAWRREHPGGAVVRLDRCRPIGDVDLVAAGGHSAVLVVVDDAERFDDPDGVLAALLARPGVTFAVAARLEAVRVAYGHWTRDVARSRCGVVMTSMGDLDAELLGATLPRRSMVPPRPGLAWIIDQDGHRLVQVAARMPP
jgi:S-DNA-T family DNA segregation ATPase FtsK/SpoIIIE